MGSAVSLMKGSVPSAERWKVVKGEHWGPLDGLVEVSNRGNLRSSVSGADRDVGSAAAAEIRKAMAAMSDEMIARATAEAWLGASMGHWILFMDGNRRNRRLHNLAVLRMVMKSVDGAEELRPVRKTNGEPVFELVVKDVFGEIVAYDPNRGRFYKQFSDKCLARVPDSAAGVRIDGHEKAFWEIGDRLSDGRLKMYLGRKTVYGSRLAIFMVTGQWPIHPVEFIDGDNKNLRISNLRRT